MSNTPRVDEELQRLNDAIRAGEKCGDVAEAYAWEFARQLERENAELKQKAEAAESLLLTIQAWDIDKHELRGHQCLAKQWICSFQDRINRYKLGKKMSSAPRTRGPMEHSRPATEFEVMQQEHIEQLWRENAELREAVRRLEADGGEG